ncbi:8676_t:CDS:10 [Cetraspora pellucida]|uniref:8676_t:CDS:1 n=1 Tax=Cetraspora pellucida TaxID=1433469 RepID=A0A9N9DNG9_9GLOM|nr:8676_t:CDS:10 [Cetraspora pellucida]
MSTSKTIHEYFRRKVSDWDIVRFLNEYTNIESYRQKIECYLSSLELIANTENGQRRKKALELQKLYREASIGWRGRDLRALYHSSLRTEPQKQYWDTDDLCACLMFKSPREKMHSYLRIHIHHSTINGTVQEITNGVYGTMSGEVFDVKLAPKRSNQKEDNDEGSKRMKIDQYFYTRAVTPLTLSQEKSKVNTDSLDCSDVKDSPSQEQELPPDETLKGTIMERLINSKSSIARYQIIFLPERNLYDPIRCLYVNKEWLMMESTWEKIEKKIVSSLPPIAENLESLLEKYNKAIIDATTGYYVDLQKVWITISESPFVGEVENIDRKTQLDLTRDVDKCKSCVGSWHHDTILTIKAGNKDFQIAFGERNFNFSIFIIKISKRTIRFIAMRLALPKLLKLLPENVPGIEELETFRLLVYKKEFLLYSMHYVDGIYFVDQYDGFTIPDTPLQLENISDIIRIMLMFKILKGFKRGSTLHANDDDSDILASIH